MSTMAEDLLRRFLNEGDWVNLDDRGCYIDSGYLTFSEAEAGYLQSLFEPGPEVEPVKPEPGDLLVFTMSGSRTDPDGVEVRLPEGWTPLGEHAAWKVAEGGEHL